MQCEREHKEGLKSGRPKEEGDGVCECDVEEVVRVDGGGKVSGLESLGQHQVAEAGHTHQRKGS